MSKNIHPSPFSCLPNELVYLILNKCDTTETRYNFSRVCRNFNSIALDKKFEISRIPKNESHMSYAIFKTFLQDHHEELPDKSLGIKILFEPGAHLTKPFLKGLSDSEPKAKQLTLSQCFIPFNDYMGSLPENIETLLLQNIRHCNDDLNHLLNNFQRLFHSSTHQGKLPNLTRIEISFKSEPELFQIYWWATHRWHSGPLYVTVFEEDSDKELYFIGKLFENYQAMCKPLYCEMTEIMLSNLKDQGFFRGREVKSVSLRKNTGTRAFNAQGKPILEVSMTVICRRD